jgi:hypothetical protein
VQRVYFYDGIEHTAEQKFVLLQNMYNESVKVIGTNNISVVPMLL